MLCICWTDIVKLYKIYGTYIKAVMYDHTYKSSYNNIIRISKILKLI
jgi:hypothetical protein